MPKINAPTVREHHERMLASLVDAAEAVLRDEGPDGLTAASVSARAGVARNSIYRYVDSVDDLRGLVVERYMPEWFAAVQYSMDSTDDPREQILAWAHANLEQATRAGHGWLMRISKHRLDPNTSRTVDHAHHSLSGVLVEAWTPLAPTKATVAAEMTAGVLYASMHEVEAGAQLDEAQATLDAVVRALIATLGEQSAD
ncbi:DNA-binding transcriptional regulator, AcrR family [Propionibacterium cyclohexanicum]|uniref:DNA-binding transcriptional regulator, AcrR family n=1 Tax=Propionibacterium cyclohexanicum TaxID=64702 RepID=A0A1H9QEW1_9ACTN|nr:TetR/AcrR family transcriptional regulator [Propionibacterium cyclohexanicum]SER58972.1 DNA-binding transcriptional regulator, AcrR family [Propionibacterium cyclohexanicum]